MEATYFAMTCLSNIYPTLDSVDLPLCYWIIFFILKQELDQTQFPVLKDEKYFYLWSINISRIELFYELGTINNYCINVSGILLTKLTSYYKTSFNQHLKHTTTLFSLSDHNILSREWSVIVHQVQINYHGRPMVL